MPLIRNKVQLTSINEHEKEANFRREGQSDSDQTITQFCAAERVSTPSLYLQLPQSQVLNPS